MVGIDGIDVEKAYRWTELRDELAGTMEEEHHNWDDEDMQDDNREGHNYSLERSAGLIYQSETDGTWRCRECEKDDMNGKSKKYRNMQAVTIHHTKKHTAFVGKKIHHCPYCLAVYSTFSGVKTHIITGACEHTRVGEADLYTWADLLAVNTDMEREMEE